MAYKILGIVCLIVASKFRLIDGCAPYFETEQWKQKAQQMNSSANCDAEFGNPDPGVIVVGDKYCSQLFVGRAYANYVCMQNLGDSDSLKGIDCGKMSHTGDGKQPYEVSFTITCSYARSPSYSKTSLWSEAESTYSYHCSPTSRLRLGGVGGGSGRGLGGTGGIGDGGGSGGNGGGKIELGGITKVRRVKVKQFKDGRRVAKIKRTRINNENTVIENTNIIIIDAHGRPKRIRRFNGSSITDIRTEQTINATRMIGFPGETTAAYVTMTAPEPVTPRLMDTVLQAMNAEKVKQFIKNAERQTELLIQQKAHLQNLVEQLGRSNDDLQHRAIDLQDMVTSLIKKNLEILSLLPGNSTTDVDQSNIDKMMETFNKINQHMLRQYLNRIKDLEDKLNKANQEKLETEAKINDLNRQYEDEIAKLRSTFDEKLKDLDNRKADKADLDKLRADFMNDMENARYKYLDELKNRIEKLEELKRKIGDQTRRIEELENEYKDLGARLKEDINDLRNAINDRLSVSRDTANTINDLNYRIKSLESEMSEIKKYMDRANPQNNTNNYNNIYNDHRDLHNSLVNTLKQLMQTFQQNQPQLRTPPEKFDDRQWQQLIEKLNDAKAAAQSFTYNHKMLHQNFNVDNSVSNVQKNLYQFFYLTGEKAKNPNVRPLMDPSTLALTDNASPEPGATGDSLSSRGDDPNRGS